MAYVSYFNLVHRIIEKVWLTSDSDLDIIVEGGVITFNEQLKEVLSGRITTKTEVIKTLDDKAKSFVEGKVKLPNHWGESDLAFSVEMVERCYKFYSNILAIEKAIEAFDPDEHEKLLSMEELEALCEDEPNPPGVPARVVEL